MKPYLNVHISTAIIGLLFLLLPFAKSFGQADTTAIDSLKLEDIAPANYTPKAERIFTDSIVTEKAIVQGNHSPSKAAMLSSVFPGLGQIYNKKYWKLPIVYGALGAAVYDERQLIELQNYYRQQRDLSIILGALAYGLNILDAYVDAHLMYYDVSEDLSLRWEPALINNQANMPSAIGVGVTLSFK